MKNLLSLAVIISIWISGIPAFGFIIKNGNVSGEYWNNNQTYFVNGNLTVDAGSALEIEAGARVKFALNTSIHVFGTILGNGTTVSNIIFTSMDDNDVGEEIPGSDGNPHQGDWGRISISNTGQGIFNHTIVRYGGYGGNGNINLQNPVSFSFENSQVSYSQNNGIYAFGGSPVINNCEFHHNLGYVVYLSDVTIKPYSGNSGSNNTIPAFAISGTIDQNLSLSQSVCGFPYVLNGGATLTAGHTLTIPAGEIIKSLGGNLTIFGTLNAIGTSSQNIVFTSLYDDTYGGDLNGDGSATTPAKGDWSFISMSGPGTNNEGIGNMDHCKVLYAGYGNNLAVQYHYSDEGYFTHSLIQYSDGRGFQAQYCTVTATHNSFLNCDNYGVESMNAALNLDYCIMNNNGNHGIYSISGGELQINNCQFNNNTGYAAYLSDVNVKTYTNNTGSGNTINAFGMSGTIDQDLTLSQSICGFPYVLNGGATLTAGHTLTIPAGEIIKSLGGSLTIYGTLNAIGTSSQNIVFTSLYDDTYGGDLNGDGSATTPAKGDWSFISMSGPGTNNEGIGNMDHCKVLYAGYGNNLAVQYYYSDQGYFTHSLIQHSDGRGFQAQYCTMTATHNSFLNCDNYGVESMNAVLNLDYCIMNNNGNHGIYSTSGGELQISNCQFNNNAGYAAYLSGVNVKTYTNNTGSGNTINAFGISGTIDQDLTLSQSICGFPYVLNGGATLTAGHTLTIPAGEIIKSLGGSLTIYGTLNAIGTSSQNIVFTSLYDDTYGGDLNGDGSATTPAKGDWSFISMSGPGTNNEGIGNMDHCKVLYAGYGNNLAVQYHYSDEGHFTHSLIQYSDGRGFQAQYCTVTATHNSFLNCDNYGVESMNATLNLDYCIMNNNGNHGIYSTSGGELQINNCQFNNNAGYAAYLSGVNVKTYANNTGSGNTINAFGMSGTIDQDLTLSQSICGFPYVLNGGATLTAGHTLTIPAGEIIKSLGGSLTIYGTLNAIGTSSQNIVFTSFYDDTYGGDLNGDGAATTPAKGDWSYISMSGPGTNNEGIGNMDHCKVLYAGYGNNLAVQYHYSDEGYFTHSLIQYSDGRGLKIDYTSIPVRESTFSDNDNYGLEISGSPVPDLGQNNLQEAGLNTFVNNNGGGFQLINYSNLPINAYYNDWGYYTASEIDAHIYDDDESGSLGQVHFEPWYDPSNAPFIVNFGADTLSGEAPLAVQFIDSTLFNPISWQWDFENDGTVDATDQHPQWMYYDEGLYSVKLKASNATTTDSLVKTDFITIAPNQHLRSYALDFDGIDDYVEVAGFDYPEDLTIEGWIKPGHFDDYQEIVYFTGDHSVQFRLDPGGMIVFGENANGMWSYVFSDTGRVFLQQWNHLAVTKEGDHVNLYINGVHAAYSQFDNDPVVTDMYFGTRSNSADRCFEGLMDEIRIWSVARTQAEIQGYMTSYLTGTEPGLQAYYRMNDVAGQKVADLTGNSYDGRLGATAAPDDKDPAWTQTVWPYDIYLLADFSATPLSGIVPLEVHFTDFSMGGPASWQWDFDNDGTIDAYDQNPVWTYANAGLYSVKLIVAGAKTTDTLVKNNYIQVDYPAPVSIEVARQLSPGTLVTVEGIVTSGTEYGALKFIQDATGGMALYGPELNYFRMGQQVRVTGELTDYFGLLEMVSFIQHTVLSSQNPLPEPKIITVNELDEQYESQIVRIDGVDFADGGNPFAAATNHFLSDGTGSTYLRIHSNSNLINQRIPDLTVSQTGICVHFNGHPTTPYCIYGRDYNDLIYTSLDGWNRQSSGFSKRYSFINSLHAVDEDVVWATAYDVKGLSTVNQVTMTTNGGDTWQALSIPNSAGLFKGSVFALDASKAWVVAYLLNGINPQGIYATLDGGFTWTHQNSAVFDINTGAFPNIVYFWDAATGVCMGDPTNGYFEIYTTGNGGNNWNRVSQTNIPDPLPGEYGLVNEYAVAGNTLRFSTNMGRLYSTSDFGANWSVVQTPLTNFFQVAFRDENNGLILQQSDLALYKTTDGGLLWQAVNYTGPVKGYDLKHIPGTPETFVSTSSYGFNAGISISTDGGASWQYFPETLGVHAGATAWVDEHTGWVGANNVDASEGGVWKYNGTPPAVTLDLKVFLQEPFTGSQMNTTMNTGGLLPLSQPYNTAPWYYNGTEAVASIPNADVVDWVLLELRDAPDAPSAGSLTTVAQQAAFLLKNGSITGVDGTPLPQFIYTPVQSLFVVIRHRNHIGIMSANPLIESSGVYSYDCTSGASQVYGGALAHKQIAPGIWGMIAADGNADNQINNADKNAVWALQAGTGGYKSGDFNMDAQVNNSDKNDVWKPNTGLGGQVPQ